MPVLAVGGEKSFGTTMAKIMQFAASDVQRRRDPGLRPLDHGGEPDRDGRDGARFPDEMSARPGAGFEGGAGEGESLRPLGRRRLLPAELVVMLALLVVWQLGVQWLGVKEYILPTPISALRTLADPNYRWTANFLATLYSVLGAFALSAVLGVLLAIVVVWNDLLMRTVMPVLILFNTLPKIALAPLFVVWLGYGIWPNIVIGTTIAFFPMVVNTAVGLASAEPRCSSW